VIPLNDTAAIKEAFALFKDQVAAVIIEGIPANNGLIDAGRRVH
jgi:glutamate-1-semialdehyde 2,1-aminomutase